MKIYKENIVRCREFYNSDYYKILLEKDPDFVEVIFTELCLDADACDLELYNELAKKYNLTAKKYYLVDENKIKLSADVICGRKRLVRHRNRNFELWIKDYEIIRGNLDFHFIWPKHKLPTINTYRYQIYKDRMDCLLFDLKMFFAGEDTPMKKAYENEETMVWLKKFLSFENFIYKMKLERFVNSDYEVLDLSKNDGSVIKDYLKGKELESSLSSYLENILSLAKK